MAEPYKLLKEDFVSNLSGGEVSEINAVTAIAPVSASKCTHLTHVRVFLISILDTGRFPSLVKLAITPRTFFSVQFNSVLCRFYS